jgi:hypothetical protein
MITTDGKVFLRTELDHTNLATDVYGIVTQTGHVTHPSKVKEAGVELIIPNPNAALAIPWHEKGHDLPQVYATVSNVTSLYEGRQVVFTVSTTNLPAGTKLYWVNIGTTTADDFTNTNGRNSGEFTVDSNGKARITLALLVDTIDETQETICLEIHADGITGPVLATSNQVYVYDN